MSPENPEDPEVLLQPRSAAPATAAGGLLDGHPGPPAPRVAGPVLRPEALDALQRLVDALVDEPGGSEDEAPADRVPTAELDDVVRLLGGEGGPVPEVLLLAHRAVALRLERDNLRVALETNRSISAAVGVLMGLHHVTQDDAFDLLVRASQNRNRKLRDIAEDVIRTGVLPASEEPE
ncbi:ANTAR domain-containing protein [Intrasporangium flavum]|uniref:ANTAR domain-containing protein n=1 Tax=Intrasporangium flavum TaxID=1428657 RepID=UPI00096C85FF|nr:ANTAR domain-containing protein [Intrasporangium flavum]